MVGWVDYICLLRDLKGSKSDHRFVGRMMVKSVHGSEGAAGLLHPVILLVCKARGRNGDLVCTGME